MNGIIYIISFILLGSAGVFVFDDALDAVQDVAEPSSRNNGVVFVPAGIDASHLAKVTSEQGFDDASRTEEDEFIPKEVPKEVPKQEPPKIAQGAGDDEPPRKLTTNVQISDTPSLTTPSLPPSVTDIAQVKEVANAVGSYLFGDDTNQRLFLSGILQLTNAERHTQGLPPLELNAQLSTMASIKLNDMFDQNYFDHVSPQGIGVGDLANQVGYRYLLVGENLAFGDFKDNEHLVESWMESPGHRANILHQKYSQIGIAVAKGSFNGQETWMAVQEFGLPRDVCPYPSNSMKQDIDRNAKTLESTKATIDSQRATLEGMSPSDTNYLPTVNEFNATVNQYNAQVAQQKNDIATYNAQVNSYNQCIESNT